MRAPTVLAALAAVGFAKAQSTTVPVTGLLGNATMSQGEPDGATYVATFPDSTSSSSNSSGAVATVRGSVIVATNPSGNGTSIQISL
ncbi:Cell surface superoxide dismutase [Cu-Zn] 4, partial [Elasticomyces elasticus]